MKRVTIVEEENEKAEKKKTTNLRIEIGGRERNLFYVPFLPTLCKKIKKGILLINLII